MVVRQDENPKNSLTAALARRGFSMIELMMVLLITGVVMGFSIPVFMTMTQTLRTGGDSRNLAGVIAEAKMRAAANFTHSPGYANLSANSYHVEVWNKGGNSGAGCWQTDGDIVNSCTAASSPTTNLSSAVAFGYGSNVSSSHPRTRRRQLAKRPFALRATQASRPTPVSSPTPPAVGSFTRCAFRLIPLAVRARRAACRIRPVLST